MDIRNWITEAIRNISSNREGYELTDNQVEVLDYFDECGINQLDIVEKILDQIELEDLVLKNIEDITI